MDNDIITENLVNSGRFNVIDSGLALSVGEKTKILEPDYIVRGKIKFQLLEANSKSAKATRNATKSILRVKVYCRFVDAKTEELLWGKYFSEDMTAERLREDFDSFNRPELGVSDFLKAINLVAEKTADSLLADFDSGVLVLK